MRILYSIQATWDEAVEAKRFELQRQEPLLELDDEDWPDSDEKYLDASDEEEYEPEEELWFDSIDQVCLILTRALQYSLLRG